MYEIISWIDEYKMLILFGVGIVFTYFWLISFNEKLRLTKVQAVIYSVYIIVMGVLSIKVFSLIEQGDFGGMRLFGGLFFMPAAYYLFAKLTHNNPGDVLSICTMSFIFTTTSVRFNCLFSGCCGGTYIPGLDNVVWPTQLMEIVFHIIVFYVFLKKFNNGNIEKNLYPKYMVLYGIFRFIQEWFRKPDIMIGVFHIAHIWSIIAIIIGMIVLIKTDKTKIKRKGGVR